jgi:hypothetical protein
MDAPLGRTGEHSKAYHSTERKAQSLGLVLAMPHPDDTRSHCAELLE